MLGLIAALALAPTAPAIDPSTVTSGAALSIGAWWEKITVTMDGDGKTQSCKYESSTAANASKPCKVVGGADGATPAKEGAKGELSTITFERRFDPSRPGAAAVATGDTLLGREVMSLAIDAAGKVSGCKTLAVSGNMSLQYGCDEASAEKFEASAAALAGFMTISVYGHSEHVA